MRTTISSEEMLHSLVHDLRQPLSNLETSLFYLDLVLENPSVRVYEQMRVMERQVAQAAQLLDRASEELRALRGQRTADECAVAPESLPLTKPATAAVT
jgi:signal transduction histidine kinase